LQSRATRKKYSTEDKIRIVLSGLRGEYSFAEMCRRQRIAQSLYYSWSKVFLEAGRKKAERNRAQDRLVVESGRPIQISIGLNKLYYSAA
jgi:transposase-like protein